MKAHAAAIYGIRGIGGAAMPPPPPRGEGPGEPTFLRLGNIWLTINGGGGGTDDKPDVIAAPPRDSNVLSNFLNLRVSDIKRYYELWSSRGDRNDLPELEMRCRI